MLTSRCCLGTEQLTQTRAVGAIQRGLLESVGVAEVFPSFLRLVQSMDEGIPSISEIFHVVKILHIQNGNAEIVSRELFPVALAFIRRPFSLNGIEGDG